ncbi:MAG: DUF3500 domain-containing protein [Caulobacteraceae bacterium]
MSNNFRDLLPGPDHPQQQGLAQRDAVMHGDRMLNSERGQAFHASWIKRLDAPFVGITCDGCAQQGLYPLVPNGAPAAAMTAAARALLALASDEERAQLLHPVDGREIRMWSNPELYLNRHGVRMEETSPAMREAILDVLKATLSDKGFHKARACMLMNDFLGKLVGGEKVMNEFSYNFSLFGEPSETSPWGWQLHGHHLALNVMLIDGHLTVSPTFMGAEPNIIDEGPHKGLTIFTGEEAAGLALMRSLPQDQRDRAQIYKKMYDPAMPPGRFHPADQRHLGGAFHDNRIIPYEGVTGAEMTGQQRKALVQLSSHFIEYLPEEPLRARLDQIEQYIDDTHFCWIGLYGDEDPYYFRIQSPVIMIEFDHHSGVFLANKEPAKCHIHTIVRAPNGNDYGKDLLRQHYQDVHGVGGSQ